MLRVMIKIEEILDNFSKILGRKVDCLYHVPDMLAEKDIEGMVAGKSVVEKVAYELKDFIDLAVGGKVEGFDKDGMGVVFAKRAYNRLLDKFSGLEIDQRFQKYDVPEPQLMRRRARRR